MKIIIAGGGKIGYSVADILSGEGHDITVIDTDPETVMNISNNLDVICVEGSATSVETLIEAGAKDADLVFAAMRSDEMNMVCGITAHKLGSKHVIARIRDDTYMRQTEFLREVLGLSKVVNPELECAREIARILRFPSAVRVDSFSKGRLEIIEHRVSKDSKLDGMKMCDLARDFGAKVLIGIVQRGSEAIIPNGSFVLQNGDMLTVTGTVSEMRRFFVAAGQYKKPVKNVMIMGGGRITVHLTRLLHESGISVTVVESSPERCDSLCELIPEARIINADATRSEVLQEEGIRTADAFVALTGDDGDNIVTSLYAKSFNVGKIVVKANREYYTDILTSAGIDAAVTPKATVSQQLAQYVRAKNNSQGSSMETLYRLADGKAEALEFAVSSGSAIIGKPLKELHFKPNTLLCAVVRGNTTIIPDGSTVIAANDHVVVVTGSGWLKRLEDILEDKA